MMSRSSKSPPWEPTISHTNKQLPVSLGLVACYGSFLNSCFTSNRPTKLQIVQIIFPISVIDTLHNIWQVVLLNGPV
jgi:hypothetical protein